MKNKKHLQQQNLVKKVQKKKVAMIVEDLEVEKVSALDKVLVRQELLPLTIGN